MWRFASRTRASAGLFDDKSSRGPRQGSSCYIYERVKLAYKWSLTASTGKPSSDSDSVTESSAGEGVRRYPTRR